MNQNTDTASFALLAAEAGFDPIEERLRASVRATIEAVFEEELTGFLGRLRYDRGDGPATGYRHGHRERQLTGTFGTETVRVPRARIEDETGKVTEWRSKALPRYQRLTKKAEALIAAVCLAGTNTRRVKRALFGLFEGAVGKDVVSRAWRKVKVDWDAWCARDLAGEDIVRLILDGTVIRTRLDRKSTNISVLAAIGVRRDGQKVLLSIRNMGGESTAAWRQFPDDLDIRGLKQPEFVIVDGAPGLEAALVALWGEDLPIQRCTVHKHRNLLAQRACFPTVCRNAQLIDRFEQHTPLRQGVGLRQTLFRCEQTKPHLRLFQRALKEDLLENEVAQFVGQFRVIPRLGRPELAKLLL